MTTEAPGRVPIHDAHVGSGLVTGCGRLTGLDKPIGERLHPDRAKFALPTSGVGGNGHGPVKFGLI